MMFTTQTHVRAALGLEQATSMLRAHLVWRDIAEQILLVSKYGVGVYTIIKIAITRTECNN